MHTHTRSHTCSEICTHTHTHTHSYTHMLTHVCLHTHTHAHTHAHTHSYNALIHTTHTHSHTHSHTCTHRHTHTRSDTCTHTHTHIHVHLLSGQLSAPPVHKSWRSHRFLWEGQDVQSRTRLKRLSSSSSNKMYSLVAEKCKKTFCYQNRKLNVNSFLKRGKVISQRSQSE